MSQTPPLAAQTSIKNLEETAEKLTNAVSSSRDLGFNYRKLSTLFRENSECIFMKDHNCRMLYTNESFDRLFAGKVTSPIGLKSNSFLPHGIRDFSTHSDSMILGGCRRVELQYSMDHAEGGRLNAITIKLPLTAAGGAVQGILGLSQPLRPIQQHVNLDELMKLSRIVNGFKTKDKAVTKAVCDGISNKRIAKLLDMPIRSVENRRRSVLKKLEIDSTVDLIKLIVRMEDAGLIDLRT